MQNLLSNANKKNVVNCALMKFQYFLRIKTVLKDKKYQIRQNKL